MKKIEQKKKKIDDEEQKMTFDDSDSDNILSP